MSIRTDIDEFKEAIDKGYISGNTVAIVRKTGKIFDYVLLHEEVREEEVVTVERVLDVLRKLS
ncbi:TPA: Paratox [Streptococcus agalactiae]|uniref:competence regulator inhibitor paratox n=1 Tax=Streptococcus agalactiae TaxID=1311 RepID=UPI0009A4E15F|nr:Paratox [Streptococcus agalactiae]